MPFYYDVNFAATSNGSANTESDHLRFLTVANQESARIVGIYGAPRSTTAGGLILRVKTFGTPSSVGSAATIGKRDPNNPAASTTVFTGPTAGSTPLVRLGISVAQTGGGGAWTALEPSHAFQLLPNGGTSGNLDVFSIAPSTSQNFDLSVEFAEGA